MQSTATLLHEDAAIAVGMAPAVVTLASGGVVRIYGRDETTIEAGRRLSGKLNVTVLLSRPNDIMPHRGL